MAEPARVAGVVHLHDLWRTEMVLTLHQSPDDRPPARPRDPR